MKRKTNNIVLVAIGFVSVCMYPACRNSAVEVDSENTDQPQIVSSKNQPIVEQDTGILEKGPVLEKEEDTADSSSVEQESEKLPAKVKVHGKWHFERVLHKKYRVERVATKSAFQRVWDYVLRVNSLNSFKSGTALRFPPYAEVIRSGTTPQRIRPELMLVIEAIEMLDDNRLLFNKNTGEVQKIALNIHEKIDEAISGLENKTVPDKFVFMKKQLSRARGNLHRVRIMDHGSTLHSKTIVSTQRCLVRALGYAMPRAN